MNGNNWMSQKPSSADAWVKELGTQPKADQSAEIADQVREFLSKGNEIDHIEPGVAAEPVGKNRGFAREIDGKAVMR